MAASAAAQLLTIIASILISATAAAVNFSTVNITITTDSSAAAAIQSLSTSSPRTPEPSSHDFAYPSSLLASILSELGFRELSAVTANVTITPTTPTTVFAPTDSSLLSCPSCSLPLLLQEHSIPGLYSHHFLRKLAFGTKVETLAPNRCLTITSTTAAAPSAIKVFVNGVEITHPDLFNNGLIIVHGLQGFVSHLSPLSCNIERMTSLSFPPRTPTPEFPFMRLMLRDAMLRLRISGYSILAIAMRARYAELSDLRSMTVFALDDASIFATGGHTYLNELPFHIVPNRILMAADLVTVPIGTFFPTMEAGEKLMVTTAGGGGPLVPMRINYVKIRSLDLLYNNRIAVHAITTSFPHVDRLTTEASFDQIDQQTDGPQETKSDFNKIQGICDVPAPAPKIEPMVRPKDQLGL